MKKKFINFINEYSMEMGIVFLIIAFLLLINQLRKKHPLNFKGTGSLSWRADVYTWGLIIILILLGLANINRI